MKKETIKRIRLGYGILLGAMAVVAGICLMVACVGIYRSGGDQIFTAEKVSAAFATIAVPVYLALVLAMGGFLLDFALPSDSKKLKAEKNPAATLDRLMSKRDLERCEPALKQQILAQRKLRRRDSIFCFALLALGSIVFLCYGLNPANFHQSEINASMVKAVTILLVCLAVPFGCGLAAAYRAKASLNREVELVKQIPAGEKAPAPAVKTARFNGLLLARCLLLAVGIGILVFGFLSGGTADVLTKAVNICTECVGLG